MTSMTVYFDQSLLDSYPKKRVKVKQWTMRDLPHSGPERLPIPARSLPKVAPQAPRRPLIRHRRVPVREPETPETVWSRIAVSDSILDYENQRTLFTAMAGERRLVIGQRAWDNDYGPRGI